MVSEARDGTIFQHFIEGFSAESPVSLTLTKVIAIYYSRALLRPLQGSIIYGSIESAIRKISTTLPAASLRLMRELEDEMAVGASGSKDYSRSREVIDKLAKEVLHRYTAHIEHTAVGYKKTVRGNEILPNLVCERRSDLVAYDGGARNCGYLRSSGSTQSR